MKLLYIINTVNMKNELIAQPKAYIQEKVGQDNSHTYSYLEARNFYKEQLGQIMGLDLAIETELLERLNLFSKPEKGDKQ